MYDAHSLTTRCNSKKERWDCQKQMGCYLELIKFWKPWFSIPSTCDHTLCSCRRALSWVFLCCLMNSSPHVQLSSSPVWQTTWDTRWLTQPQRKCITWPLQKANARHTVKALDPVSWPEDKFDMKYGGAEVLHLCKVLSGVKRGVFLCTCYIRSSTKSCQDCCCYH